VPDQGIEFDEGAVAVLDHFTHSDAAVAGGADQRLHGEPTVAGGGEFGSNFIAIEARVEQGRGYKAASGNIADAFGDKTKAARMKRNGTSQGRGHAGL
jgi:hypothetical protein